MSFMMTNPAAQNLPPMLKSYLEYKEKHKDCLLFFQVGDFFELFFDDAVQAARALNLTLTSRNKNSPDPIPMCGVPVAVIDTYVERLLTKGFSAALVRQASESDGRKGMVERELERIVTPAVRILSNTETEGSSHILASIMPGGENDFALAYSDVNTGTIYVRENLSLQNLFSEAALCQPAEILLPRRNFGKTIDRRLSWVKRLEERLAILGGIKFFECEAIGRGKFESHRSINKIKGFSTLTPAAKQAAKMLIAYVDETTVSSSINFREIRLIQHKEVLSIDATTRAHLELVRNSRDGGEELTLLSVMDLTTSRAGKRMLREWILSPLTDMSQINLRLDTVEKLKEQPEYRRQLRALISSVIDFERIAARIELGVILPRELGSLRDALSSIERLSASLAEAPTALQQADLFRDLCSRLTFPRALYDKLTEVLVDEPAAGMNEGNIVKRGFNLELDQLYMIKSDGSSWITKLELEEKNRTGISSLKIKFNNVFGYFIEITKPNLDRVPPDYIRKQTMVNAERFITESLKQTETKILGAKAKIIEIEKKLFEDLRKQIKLYSDELRELASIVSCIDVLQSLAELAEREDFSRPEITSLNEMLIVDGSHPVLTRILGADFVLNSLEMNEKESRSIILTGPNMGGKSTFLRQNALIVIMAQLGSFVPARSATIGIVDQIFTRMGASDDLAEGESTFMVEMQEAANILAKASAKSLLLIDEIGRGTSTADGLAIARAIFEWTLREIKCRALFATHFHELTSLEQAYQGVCNLSVGSHDIDGEVIFTHNICKGPANKSYGLEVASLAGLPGGIIRRAREIIYSMEADILAAESNGSANAQSAIQDDRQLSFLRDDRKIGSLNIEIERDSRSIAAPELALLSEELADIDLNNTTPLQALNILEKLSARAKKLKMGDKKALVKDNNDDMCRV